MHKKDWIKYMTRSLSITLVSHSEIIGFSYNANVYIRYLPTKKTLMIVANTNSHTFKLERQFGLSVKPI